MAGNGFPSVFGPGNASDGDRGTFPAINVKPLRVICEEAESYWLDMCGMKVYPPEQWILVKPRDGQVVVGPSRSTYPFLNTVRSFCRVPEDVVICLTRDGERADAPPEGWSTMYENQLLRSRLWFPIPAIVVEVLNHFDVSISHISPRGLKCLLG
ncbi:hypothetical protein Rs2_35257 [Raphanus sativus]|nr:hypothetical protein Rs2_35257 [Raphanus sativus]